MPLPHKGVLQELTEADFASEPARGGVQRRTAAELQPVLPTFKRRAAFLVLDRHKERVRLQPIALSAAEVEESRRDLAKKARVRQPQQRKTQVVEFLVVNGTPAVRRGIRRLNFLAREQLFAAQRVEVEKIRIPRKRGERLIGRIAVAGRADR